MSLYASDGVFNIDPQEKNPKIQEEEEEEEQKQEQEEKEREEDFDNSTPQPTVTLVTKTVEVVEKVENSAGVYLTLLIVITFLLCMGYAVAKDELSISELLKSRGTSNSTIIQKIGKGDESSFDSNKLKGADRPQKISKILPSQA